MIKIVRLGDITGFDDAEAVEIDDNGNFVNQLNCNSYLSYKKDYDNAENKIKVQKR